MQPLPVGETGGRKGQGQPGRWGITRPAQNEVAEGWGDRPGWRASALYPCPARGAGPLALTGCLRQGASPDGRDLGLGALGA